MEKSKGYFAIAGNWVIGNEGVYRVFVSSHQYEHEENLEVGIMSTDEEYKNMKVVTLKGTNMKSVDFELNDLPRDDYHLSVKSLTGDPFHTIFPLFESQQKLIVLINTEKQNYIQNETVTFQVLVLDAETKPTKFDKCSIFITDSEGNRVREHENSIENFVKGVFGYKLRLTKEFGFGEYKINVKVDSQPVVTKSFLVVKTPKVNLFIETVPNVLFKDRFIKLFVKCRDNIEGTVSVTAERNNFGLEDPVKKVKKLAENIDGKYYVEFDMKKELGIRFNENFRQEVALTATFKDNVDETESTVTTNVKVHLNSSKLDLESNCFIFKPELPIHITTKLKSTFDETVSIVDDSNPVKFVVIKHFWTDWRTKSKLEEFVVQPIDGAARLNFIADDQVDRYSITVKYLHQQVEVYLSNIATNYFTKEFIQARVITETLIISKNIQIEVTGNTDFKELTYYITRRGKILESKHEKFDPTKKHVMEFQPTLLMLPKCQFTFFYFNDDGEIISDIKEVEFEKELLNHINIKLSTNEAKPGDDIEITIETEPDSYVSIMGIEQNPNDENGFNSNSIFNVLDNFGSMDSQFINSSLFTRISVLEDFRNLALITNTKRTHLNNHFSKFDLPIVNYGDISEGKDNQMAPRVWFHDELEMGTSNKTITKKVPAGNLSWTVTGFSINPQTGLGLIKQPLLVNVLPDTQA